MRLLSLVLVFVLSTMASAAISLKTGGSPATDTTISVGDTLTIQIHSSDAAFWAGYIMLDDGYIKPYVSDGEFSNPVVLPPAGDMGRMDPYYGGYLLVAASMGAVPVSSGVQFTVDYVGQTYGDQACVVLYGPASTTVPADLFEITVGGLLAELGDFDTDGDIDLYDFAIFGLAWMTSLGDGNWNEDCDISDPSDDIINGRDLGVLVGKWMFGKKPVGYWMFDEGEGDTAYDSAGDNHGTLNGDPNWVTGKIGDYALDFDGVGDYVDCGNDSSLAITGSITLAAWVKLDTVTPSDSMTILSKYDRNNLDNVSYALVFSADNPTKLRLGIANWDQSLVSGLTQDSSSVSVDTWYHVVGIYVSGGTPSGKLYINGSEVNATWNQSPPTSIKSNNEPVAIGASFDTNPERYFNGKIDEVMLFRTALSAGEIWQLYQQGLGG